jgi:mevalonate pyrophosphate decarboxylase
MTTAQAFANIAFIKNWGMVTENIAVDTLLQIF